MDRIRSHISPEDLYKAIGTASAPLVVDIRRPDDFNAADSQIVVAIRRLPTEVDQWRREIPNDRRVVVYCVRGQQVKGSQFTEVIVDYKSGAIKKAETITDADDLKAPKEQSEALAKVKQSLDTAVASAAKANSGYRAVSVMPMLNGGQPVAGITLMKGADVKKVTGKVD